MLQGIPALMTARGVTSAASSLLTGLQVYYSLSDTSDATGGGLTLTNHNTVTFSAGKVGNAANFVSASTQYLTRADNSAFQMGTGDFTLSLWAHFTTAANFVTLAMYGNPIGAAGYGIRSIGSGVAGQIGDGVSNPLFGGIGSYNDGNWHLFIATFTRSGNGVLTVDNTLDQSASISGASGSVNNTNGFAIGARYDANALTLLDGSVDECGLWNRILTGAELTALWNSGAGVTYPFS